MQGVGCERITAVEVWKVATRTRYAGGGLFRYGITMGSRGSVNGEGNRKSLFL
jgi:hypothetical protein